MKLTAPSVKELEALLGANFLPSDSDAVLPYFRNATEFRPPAILGVAKPQSPEEVQNILQIAERERIRVYTFSTGMNWGLGSKVALQEESLLLDMGGLKRIRAVNEKFRYAIVEAGVTQQELVDYLANHHPSVILPVTGSSPHSSIIGNSLERGTTFLTHRADDLRNLEAILPNGELVRTGFWHTADGQGTPGEQLHYRHGLGPDIKGLFVQSNLGVITAGVIELLPKPEATYMVWASVKESSLAAFMDRVRSLYRRGALHRIMHIGNEKRMKITGKGISSDSIWVAMSALQGAPELISWQRSVVERELSELALMLRFYSPTDNLSDVPVIQQMLDLHCGKPATIFLQAMYKSEDSGAPGEDYDVDKGAIGMLCCLPIFPMDGAVVIEGVRLANLIAERHGFMLASTINPVNDLYAESVLNLYFNRNSESEIERAHLCNTEIHEKLAELGLYFYRLDVQEMKRTEYYNPTCISVPRILKACLDPQGRIAGGKYGV